MADHVPQLEPKMLERVAALRGLPAVEAAFEVCAEEVERAMAEQIRISETESPTFAEKVRGELIMELLREYGLTDVVMDESGNVVGRRPGTGAGPVLAIAAHLDTVFPAGTDLKVTKDGALYRGPGIGDNASGLRSMLRVTFCLWARLEKKATVTFEALRRSLTARVKLTASLRSTWPTSIPSRTAPRELTVGASPLRERAVTLTSTTAWCPRPFTPWDAHSM